MLDVVARSERSPENRWATVPADAGGDGSGGRGGGTGRRLEDELFQSLTAISGFAELLATRNVDEAQRAAWHALVRAETDRLGSTIRRLAACARTGCG